MPIVETGSIPMRSIRESLGPGFKAWDASVERVDRLAAKRARRMIQAAAYFSLPQPAAAFAGWYLFADLEKMSGVEGLNYIGIAKTQRRPMGRRLIDRFKDDSCLDIGLDDLPEGEQRNIVKRRLLTALPRSGANYVDKHMKTANLVRQSTHILIIGSNDETTLIEEVERCLISTAARAGAPLTNVTHRKFRGIVSTQAEARVREIFSVLSAEFGIGEMALPPQMQP